MIGKVSELVPLQNRTGKYSAIPININNNMNIVGWEGILISSKDIVIVSKPRQEIK
ncbi:sensor histidine kinase domain containing protein [Bacillus cereus BGSC 6E1]|nr:sensor histidine kinase domain containing protein [Bacillus cereus BGSC 6E1]